MAGHVWPPGRTAAVRAGDVQPEVKRSAPRQSVHVGAGLSRCDSVSSGRCADHAARAVDGG
jgi:hypothetical protein